MLCVESLPLDRSIYSVYLVTASFSTSSNGRTMGPRKINSPSRLWRRLLLLLILFGSMLPGLGCRPNASANSSPKVLRTFDGDYPIKATVTVGMVADLVRAIGGEHIEVTQLMGAGVDPHLYKPTRDDSAAILSADIVFYNGLMLEGKMSELLSRIGKSKTTFAAAESLSPERIHGGIEAPQAGDATTTSSAGDGHVDPHVWMDVSMWNLVAGAIGDELARFDPEHADAYHSATADLQAQLEGLHAYGVEVIGCVADEQKVLVTSHDAFQYFGAAYGIEVQAVQGISTESEAGLNRINQLVDMLVERKVEAVFVESSVPRESIEALLRGAGARGQTVEIGGSLFSDAMGNEGTYEGTYLGMMDHNLTIIARALGCKSVPPKGYQGLLVP